MYGDGQNVRDWLSAEDHCRAVDLILQRGRVGEVYNVGGGCEVANIDVVKRILHELGRPESLISFVEDRKGHDRRYAVDFSKLREELGWQPQVEFARGLSETIRWYLENDRWSEGFAGGGAAGDRA